MTLGESITGVQEEAQGIGTAKGEDPEGGGDVGGTVIVTTAEGGSVTGRESLIGRLWLYCRSECSVHTVPTRGRILRESITSPC